MRSSDTPLMTSAEAKNNVSADVERSKTSDERGRTCLDATLLLSDKIRQLTTTTLNVTSAQRHVSSAACIHGRSISTVDGPLYSRFPRTNGQTRTEKPRQEEAQGRTAPSLPPSSLCSSTTFCFHTHQHSQPIFYALRQDVRPHSVSPRHGARRPCRRPQRESSLVHKPLIAHKEDFTTSPVAWVYPPSRGYSASTASVYACGGIDPNGTRTSYPLCQLQRTR